MCRKAASNESIVKFKMLGDNSDAESCHNDVSAWNVLEVF
jgi:hypothetical protein